MIFLPQRGQANSSLVIAPDYSPFRAEQNFRSRTQEFHDLNESGQYRFLKTHVVVHR